MALNEYDNFEFIMKQLMGFKCWGNWKLIRTTWPFGLPRIMPLILDEIYNFTRRGSTVRI